MIKINKTILLVFVLLVSIAPVNSFFGGWFGEEDEGYDWSMNWPWDKDREAVGELLLDWYPVEDWEVEFCVKDGGTDKVSSTLSLPQGTYLSELTISFNAEKETTPENQTLYKVSYYIQPVKDDIKFAVRVSNSTNNLTMHDIQTGATASYISPGRGYSAFYSNETYDVAKMRYITPGADRILIVPVVYEDYLELCSVCGLSNSETGSSEDPLLGDW